MQQKTITQFRKMITAGGALLAMLLFLAPGCRFVQSNIEETSTDAYQMTVKTFWGKPEKLPLQEEVFLPDTSQYEVKDGYAKWWNKQATEEIMLVDENAEENNCRVHYQSGLGSIKDFPVTSLGEFIWNADFFEADMNGDGAKDLVIKTICDAGMGLDNQMIYLYDFQTKETVLPFAQKNGKARFTAAQEESILKVFQEWENNGMPEIRLINNKTLSVLNYNSFCVDIVEYKKKMAIQVKFSDSYHTIQEDEYSGSFFTAVLVWKDMQFVVDKVWYENTGAQDAAQKDTQQDTQKESGAAGQEQSVRRLWGVKETLIYEEKVFAYEDKKEKRKHCRVGERAGAGAN